MQLSEYNYPPNFSSSAPNFQQYLGLNITFFYKNSGDNLRLAVTIFIKYHPHRLILSFNGSFAARRGIHPHDVKFDQFSIVWNNGVRCMSFNILINCVPVCSNDNQVNTCLRWVCQQFLSVYFRPIDTYASLNFAIIGPSKGLAPVQCQAIIQISAGLLVIWLQEQILVKLISLVYQC